MTALDRALALLLLALNILLNWRIFLPGVTPYRGSIESGYASMARLLAQHPNPWAWNPLQYCGLPVQMTYLPLLPYWNALWVWVLPGVEPTHIHRLTCALALCAGPAVVYILVRYFTASRRTAFYTALAVSFLCPLYALIQTISLDRGILQVPWRIQVLIKYGEGPHTVGLTLLPLAIIAVHRCALRSDFPSLWLAATALAVVVLTNWVAGLATAFCVVALLLCYGSADGFSWRRVMGAGLLGYLLAAFWLTPTFILRMAGNWPKDAFGYQLRELEQFSFAGWVLGILILWVFSRRFLSRHRYLTFLLLCTYGFGFLVCLFYAYGINVIPESRRYSIEYGLFLLLLLCELARLLFALPKWQWAAAFAIVAGLLQQTPHVTQFVGHRYDKWTLQAREETPEFRAGAALARFEPKGRVFLSGGSRFRINSWFDLPQTGGVFETGLRNRLPAEMAFQIRTDLNSAAGEEAANSIRQLRAMAVEYIVIHGPGSEEFYRDFKLPAKFDGVLEKVWNEEADSIYRLTPMRYAHLVRPSELPARVASPYKSLQPYVDALTDPGRPVLAFKWSSNSDAMIEGTFPEEYKVAVAVSYEKGWRATQGGQELEVVPNSLGFLTISPHPSLNAPIKIHYSPPLETVLFSFVSLITWSGCAVYWLGLRRRHVSTAAPSETRVF